MYMTIMGALLLSTFEGEDRGCRHVMVEGDAALLGSVSLLVVSVQLHSPALEPSQGCCHILSHTKAADKT